MERVEILEGDFEKSFFDEGRLRTKVRHLRKSMKPLKAHWLLSDEAPTTVIHLEATPSTSDVRWMTAIVGLPL
jgi:hypothetical protein